MPSWSRIAAASLLSLALAVGVAAPGRAQDYFGQNKVRYQSFDFRVLKTEHFDVYYYPETAGIVADAARMAERWYARYATEFHHDLTRRQPLILYASHPAFEETNAISGDLGQGTGGVTEALKRRIVIPCPGPMADLDHVIGHELVHAFQYDIAGQGRSQSLGLATAARLPLWFMEGMAEYMSLGPDDPNTAMWMRSAVQAKKLPNYAHLDDPSYFPYRYGQAFWAYIAGRYGQASVGRILKAAGRSGDVRAALKNILGIAPDTLDLAWQQSLRDWSAPVAKVTEPLNKAAQPLELASRAGGHMNLAPSLSPDGRQLVFFSERSQYSIEMYVADAVTGKVKRQITKSAVDPHYQSLEFISSAGEWSPDGKLFAFTGADRGRPTLIVMDMQKAKIVRQRRFPQLGEIFSPTWSPDGKRIAFSALDGGEADLWVVDLAGGHARPLTHDEWADLEPAWSPNGNEIAFVTDRSADSVGTPRFGRYHLALIDAESGAIRDLPTFTNAVKNISPQWAPDGRSVYFVADRHGISNLYRVGVDDGKVEQLTNLLTGVSGLTSLSPAVSVARDSGQVVFSTYEASSFEIFRLDKARQLGEGITADSLPADAAALPPVTRERPAYADTVRTQVAEVDTMRFATDRYHPHFSLDYISQPSIGIGTGASGGVAVGGGAGLFWSDMLGDRQLATLLQFANIGGSVLNNTAAAVAYQNMASRWDWGLQVSQIPYITSGFAQVIDPTANTVQNQEYRIWEIYRDVEGSVAYPFNRFQRVEFSGGFRNIAFAQQLETWTYDATTGVQLSDVTQNLPSPPGLDLVTGGMALVYDNSLFGGTSPFMGQRYRFEVDQVGGSLRMNEVLADYRRYVRLARSLTLAGRVLHYGRYGPGSDDPRLQPLFLGYPWLVRGYDDTSIGNSIANGNIADTVVFNNLLGSRLAVANLELRVPLFGALGLVPSPSVPPIETALFYDAGTAWDRTDKAAFLGGDRHTVTSYGVAFRANLFGFAVGEADLVHPNDRPGQGWYWELSLQPGF